MHALLALLAAVAVVALLVIVSVFHLWKSLFKAYVILSNAFVILLAGVVLVSAILFAIAGIVGGVTFIVAAIQTDDPMGIWKGVAFIVLSPILAFVVLVIIKRFFSIAIGLVALGLVILGSGAAAQPNGYPIGGTVVMLIGISLGASVFLCRKLFEKIED